MREKERLDSVSDPDPRSLDSLDQNLDLVDLASECGSGYGELFSQNKESACFVKIL
jgi:hypothetical protein